MLSSILCIAFIFGIASAKAPISYDGSQVILIPSEAPTLLNHQFKTGDAEVWRGDETHKEIFVRAHALAEVFDILNRNHVIYSVLTKNVQTAINKERLQKTLYGMRMIKEGIQMSWDSYHSLKDIYNFTDQLAKDYPKRVRVVNVGKSVNGRPLKVAIFKSGIKNAKRIWLDGGIHAREWVSPASVTYIMRELSRLNASDDGPLSKIDFYICPVVNPDGYEYSHTTDRLWRKNRRVSEVCRGVDLNRNFKSMWKPSKTCDPQYPGLSALSEPETKHITKFILENLKNMEGFITFHAYSQVLLYPYAYALKENSSSARYRDMVSVADTIVEKLSNLDGHKYQSMQISDFADGAYGSSVDWAMDIGIKYPYAIELRPEQSSRQPGFLLPPNQIIPTAKEALEAVTVLASAVLLE